MKALIKDSKVVDVALEPFEVHPSFVWVDCPDDCQIGWAAFNGQVIRPEPPVVTPEQMIEQYKAALKYALINKANERQYDSDVSCASYVTSGNAQWKAEAEAYIAWRDNCYEYSYDYLARAQNGEIPDPSEAEFINGLPELVWP